MAISTTSFIYLLQRENVGYKKKGGCWRRLPQLYLSGWRANSFAASEFTNAKIKSLYLNNPIFLLPGITTPSRSDNVTGQKPFKGRITSDQTQMPHQLSALDPFKTISLFYAFRLLYPVFHRKLEILNSVARVNNINASIYVGDCRHQIRRLFHNITFYNIRHKKNDLGNPLPSLLLFTKQVFRLNVPEEGPGLL